MVRRVTHITCWVLIILFAGNSHLFAQDSTAVAKKNSLEKGKWALQFGIAGNLTFASLQGGTISLKKHVSNKTAIRIGITASFDLSKEKYSLQIRNNGALQTDSGYSDDVGSLYLAGSLLRQRYTSDRDRLNFYFGYGLAASASINQQNSPRYEYYNWDDARDVRIGIAGLIGIEWFMTKNLSLLGEYLSTLQYQHLELSRERSNGSGGIKETLENDGVLLDYTNARLGLSVYF